MDNYSVYRHICPNGKVYIGITRQECTRRWRSDGSGYKGQIFYRAIQKYGWSNIQHDVLYEGLSKEGAEAKEVELIRQYRSNIPEWGYNIEHGGKAVGCISERTRGLLRNANMGRTHSCESKASMSRAQRKWWDTASDEEIEARLHNFRSKTSGHNNHMFGKHHSSETKEKIRKKNSGANSSWFGRKHTAEEKAKIAQAHKKQVAMITDGKCIAVFPSVIDAAAHLNVKPGGIYKAAQLGRKSNGHEWKYLNGEVSL